jgi:predicted amidohydrolase YtcJ
MAGDLDRRALDEMVHGRPVRVQQRSGALWVINTAGLSALGVEHGDAPSGVERDAAGRATGRLWRLDGWLRGRLGPRLAPDLRQVGRDLAGHGVTGVTDATPDLDEAHLAGLLGAVASGALPQRLHLLGVDHLPTDVPPAVRERVTVGACKLVLADHDLPALPDLVARLRAIRASDRFGSRPVAVHSVSRVSLVLACVALSHAGPVRGDRIEHASVVPEGVLPVLRRLGVTVVTQPGLVSERGDDYLRDVDPGEVGDLYRHARLLDAGIPVGLSTDAPYTAADPWATIWAAVRRTTRRGRVLGPNERVDVATAVDGLTTPCDDPGGQPRRIAPGEVADLCLLEEPTITDHPAVQATVVAGVRSFAAS